MPRTNRKTDLLSGENTVLDELESLSFNENDFDIAVDSSKGKGTISLKEASGSSDSSMVGLIVAMGM